MQQWCVLAGSLSHAFKGLSCRCCIRRISAVVPSCGINRSSNGDRVSLSCDVIYYKQTKQKSSEENTEDRKDSTEMKMHFDTCQFNNSSASAKEVQTISNQSKKFY